MIDRALVHRMLTEVLEDCSPDQRARLVQAINDIKVDISGKSKRVTAINDRLQDLAELDAQIPDDQPAFMLLKELIRKHTTSLMVEAESINLAKMMKRLGVLQEELRELDWEVRVIDLVKEETHG